MLKHGGRRPHIESAHVVGVNHALAAVAGEGLARAVGVVLHRMLPVRGVPPQLQL